MAREVELVESLEKIRVLVDEALSGTKRKVTARRAKPENVEDAKRDGLPGHILRLRDSGFFKQPKTAVEVYAELQAEYHCEVDRVAMALLRLMKKGLLRKASKMKGKRRQVAYVW